MVFLKWHKLSAEKKNLIRNIRTKSFFIGSIFIEKKKLEKIIKRSTSKKNQYIILGILNDNWIPGLENCIQFKPCSEKTILDNIKDISQDIKDRIIILEHRFVDIKYIIREIYPSKIIWVNGSWSNVIHYNPVWWEAKDLKIDFETVSPFCTEKQAKKYCEYIQNINTSSLLKKWKNLTNLKKSQVKEFCLDLENLSWDWTGRIGSCITINSKREKGSSNKNTFDIVSYSYNSIMPFEAAMMHNGSLKEKEKTPVGCNIELTETVHAEVGSILNLKQNPKIKGNLEIWITAFPCPVCARIIAKSNIKTIYYIREYPNELGYKILQSVGKTLVKV